MTRARVTVKAVPVSPPSTDDAIPFVGDQATDEARSAAADADSNSTALYMAANDQLDADTGNYDEAIAHWDQVKGQMTQPDYNTCLAALQQAAQAQGAESNQVAAALGYITSGDTAFQTADAMAAPPWPPKTMAFVFAKSKYDAAPPCVTAANTAHAAFVTALATANGILSHYG